MAEKKSKVKYENYIVIQGWMISILNLKGNELLVYAIIYGFCQNGEEQQYTGGLQYLMDWTNSTKQGVLKNLNSLINKGLIVKKEIFSNNIKFCSYTVTPLQGGKQSLPGVNKVEQGGKQSLTGGGKQSLPNNIDIYNISNNNIYSLVIDYLNEKAGTNYRATTNKTKSLINARTAEGFTVDDFRIVIDKKCSEWKGTEFEQYLRPATLFGTKFESYLNAKYSEKTSLFKHEEDFNDLAGVF